MKSNQTNYIGVPLNLGCSKEGVEKLPYLLRSVWLPLNPNIKDLGDIKCPQYSEIKNTEGKAKYLSQILDVSEKTADKIKKVIEKREKAIIVGGDHSVTMGTAMGLNRAVGRENLFVIYLSSHAALHNEETSRTGDVHGMQLALMLGKGKSQIAQEKFGQGIICPEKLLILGLRNADEEEKILAKKLKIKTVEIEENITSAVLNEVANIINNKNSHILLSIDVDVIDTPATRSCNINEGLPVKKIQEIIRTVKETGINTTFEIVEALPSKDKGNQTKKEIIKIMNEIIES